MSTECMKTGEDQEHVWGRECQEVADGRPLGWLLQGMRCTAGLRRSLVYPYLISVGEHEERSRVRMEEKLGETGERIVDAGQGFTPFTSGT